MRFRLSPSISPRTTVIVALLLACMSWFMTVRAAEKAVQPLEKAQAHQAKGEHKQAVEDYNKALRQDGEEIRVYVGRGISFYQLDRYRRSIKDLERALELEKGVAEPRRAFNHRLDAYVALGAHEEALVPYLDAVLANPDDADARMRYALALLHLAFETPVGERKTDGGVLLSYIYSQQAVRQLNHVIEVDSDRAEAYRQRGRVRLRYNHHEKAIRDFNEAIWLEPGVAQDHVDRGNAHWGQGKRERAIQDFNKALKLEPNYAEALAARGRAYMALGEDQRAIEDYDRAIRQRPDYGWAYLYRAHSHYNLGHWEKAAADYTAALEHNPESVEALHNRARVYQHVGRLNEAVEDYGRLLQINPNTWSAMRDRGKLLSRLGEFGEAMENFERALETIRGIFSGPVSSGSRKLKDSALASIFAQRGRTSLQMSRFQQAEADLTRALELADEPRPVLYNLSLLHALRAYANLALDRYQQAARDGRAFIRRDHWDERWSLEAALAGVLALRHAGEDQHARRLLTAAWERAEPGSPRHTILRYLRGQIDGDQLLRDIKGKEHSVRMTARFVLGYDLLLEGERRRAWKQLLRVVERADLRNPLRPVAQALVAQLKPPEDEQAKLDLLADEDLREETKHILQSLRKNNRSLLLGIEKAELTHSFDASAMSRHKGHSTLSRVPGAFASQAVIGESGWENHLIYGPYIELPPGRYLAVWRIKRADKNKRGRGTVDVAEQGERIVRRPIQMTPASADRWQTFGLQFRAEETLRHIEFRLWQARHPLAVDRVYLFKLTPAASGE